MDARSAVRVDGSVDLITQTAILIFIDPFWDLKIKIAVGHNKQTS
jgi:hypothetical protein